MNYEPYEYDPMREVERDNELAEQEREEIENEGRFDD